VSQQLIVRNRRGQRTVCQHPTSSTDVFVSSHTVFFTSTTLQDTPDGVNVLTDIYSCLRTHGVQSLYLGSVSSLESLPHDYDVYVHPNQLSHATARVLAHSHSHCRQIAAVRKNDVHCLILETYANTSRFVQFDLIGRLRWLWLELVPAPLQVIDVHGVSINADPLTKSFLLQFLHGDFNKSRNALLDFTKRVSPHRAFTALADTLAPYVGPTCSVRYARQLLASSQQSAAWGPLRLSFLLSSLRFSASRTPLRMLHLIAATLNRRFVNWRSGRTMPLSVIIARDPAHKDAISEQLLDASARFPFCRKHFIYHLDMTHKYCTSHSRGPFMRLTNLLRILCSIHNVGYYRLMAIPKRTRNWCAVTLIVSSPLSGKLLAAIFKPDTVLTADTHRDIATISSRWNASLIALLGIK
jgi:hypothetical protein